MNMQETLNSGEKSHDILTEDNKNSIHFPYCEKETENIVLMPVDEEGMEIYVGSSGGTLRCILFVLLLVGVTIASVIYAFLN
jgi:hypothetical protein